MNKEYIVEILLFQYNAIQIKVQAENNELALNQMQGELSIGEWAKFIDVHGNSVRIRTENVVALTCMPNQ